MKIDEFNEQMKGTGWSVEVIRVSRLSGVTAVLWPPGNGSGIYMEYETSADIERVQDILAVIAAGVKALKGGSDAN